MGRQLAANIFFTSCILRSPFLHVIPTVDTTVLIYNQYGTRHYSSHTWKITHHNFTVFV